jgi:hypothetical protein
MTARAVRTNGPANRILPLIDAGYLLGQLLTGSGEVAERLVEEAVDRLMTLEREGEPGISYRVRFFQLILVSAGTASAQPQRAVREDGVPAEVARLARELAALGRGSRLAVALALADATQAEVAEILRLPRETARALIHLGCAELERRGVPACLGI